MRPVWCSARQRVDVPGEHYHAGFSPMSVVPRQWELPASDRGPGLVALEGGGAPPGKEVSFLPPESFVAGGFGRGVALRGWRVEGGVAVSRGPGVLPGFEEYLRACREDDLCELMRGCRCGVDVIADACRSEAGRKCVRAARSAAAEPGRRFVGKNSRSCRGFEEFLIAETMRKLRVGGARCLGLIEGCERDGTLPACIGRVSVEPTKPRMCVDPRLLNDVTETRSPALEGLDHIRDAVIGREGCGVTLDEKSGCSHHLVTEESQHFLGFVLFGHVFVCVPMPFGWVSGAFHHQVRGLLCAGYARHCGGDVSQHIDDHTLVGWRGNGHRPAVARCAYALLLVKGVYGGCHFNLQKAPVDISPVFGALGMLVDRVRGGYAIPPAKQPEFVSIVESVLVAVGKSSRQVHLGALARIAGKMMSFQWAIPSARLFCNATYAVLTQKPLHHGDRCPACREARKLNQDPGRSCYDRVPGAWWEAPAGALVLQLRRELVGPLTRELRGVSMLVASGRFYPFRVERRAAIFDVHQDATLVQSGSVLRLVPGPAEAPAALAHRFSERRVVFGGLTPVELAGARVAGGNTGVTEMAGLHMLLSTIDRDAELVASVRSVVLDAHMGNLEDVLAIRNSRVGGEYLLEKLALMLEIFEVIDTWNAELRLHHVASADNEGDAPSRAARWRGIRLCPALFERLAMTFSVTLDGMPSYGARQGAVPYFSLGPGPRSRGVNFFSQSLVGEIVYVFPPLALRRAVCRHVVQAGAVGLVVLVTPAAPPPLWHTAFTRRCTFVEECGRGWCQLRRPDGWEAYRDAPAASVWCFDFR